MKHYRIYLFVAVALMTFATSAYSQDTTTDTRKGKYETIELKVKGVCGMCQSRIELAVYDLKGVKKTDWDIDTEILKTVVKRGKVTREEIAEALSEAGHDNELMKASPEAYKALPGCCKYNDGVEKHGDGRK